jgi:hypothetical protein
MNPGMERLESRNAPAVILPPSMSFSMAPDGTPWLGGPVTLRSSLSPGWKDKIVRAIDEWGRAVGVVFYEVPDDGRAIGSADDRGVGIIRFGGNRDEPHVLARAYYPGPDRGSDVSINTGQDWQAFDLYSVALHELGHAIAGLNHGESPVMSPTYQGVLSGLVLADIAAARNATDVALASPAQLFSKMN